MKNIVKTFVMSATLVAALLVAASIQAKDAVLTGSSGVVQTLSKNGSWQKAAVSKPIKAGTTIRTDSGATATVRLPDVDGFAVLSGNGVVTLNNATAKTVDGQKIASIELSLAEGQLVGSIENITKGSVIVIKTPQRVFTVSEAGKFSISAGGNLQVIEGAVLTGSTKVAAGNQLAAGTDTPAAIDANAQTSLANLITASQNLASDNSNVRGAGNVDENLYLLKAKGYTGIDIMPIEMRDNLNKAETASDPFTGRNEASPISSETK